MSAIPLIVVPRWVLLGKSLIAAGIRNKLRPVKKKSCSRLCCIDKSIPPISVSEMSVSIKIRAFCRKYICESARPAGIMQNIVFGIRVAENLLFPMLHITFVSNAAKTNAATFKCNAATLQCQGDFMVSCENLDTPAARIRFFVEICYAGRIGEFATDMGYTNRQTISDYASGRTRPGQKFCERFHKVGGSAEWLMSGHGIPFAENATGRELAQSLVKFYYALQGLLGLRESHASTYVSEPSGLYTVNAEKLVFLEGQVSALQGILRDILGTAIPGTATLVDDESLSGLPTPIRRAVASIRDAVDAEAEYIAKGRTAGVDARATVERREM